MALAIVPLVQPGQIALYTVSIVFGILSTLAVALRFLAARIAHRDLDASDYCILAAWSLTVGLMIVCVLEALLGGFGWHYNDIVEEFDLGPIIQYHIILLPLEILWNLSLTATKISVLLFYMKVFGVTRIKTLAKIIMIFVALLGVSGVLVTLFICQPIQYNWDLTIPDGHCGHQSVFFAVYGITNLVTDIIVLSMPVPSLLRLKMDFWKKCSLLVTFALGYMTCVASVIRLVFLAKIEYDDVTFTSVIAVLMSSVEPSLAVILACIPLMRPLVKSGRHPRGYGTTSRTNATNAETYRWSSSHKIKATSLAFPGRPFLLPGSGHALERLASSGEND